MTGADHLSGKTLSIMEALHDAGRPLKSSEIEARTGIYRTSVSKHITWNMKNKWVLVAREEPQPNGLTTKFYDLTTQGRTMLEAVK